MRQNIIILTSGHTGSSVLTSLIARDGYWTGDDTKKKPDYDTFENADLVGLNVRLFEAAGFSREYQTTGFAPESLGKIESLYSSLDTAPYREFLKRCDMDLVKAALIYLKNYSERLELVPPSVKAWSEHADRNKLPNGSAVP